jgi:hypothetical protein
MIAMILAWVFGLALLGLIVAGFVRGRQRTASAAEGLFTPASDDAALTQRTESSRGQLQALHNAQQVGPGGGL